jgi:hypothetical protein
MNAIGTRVGFSQSRAKGSERSCAFSLPARTLICLHESSLLDEPPFDGTAEIIPFAGPSSRPLRQLNESRQTAELVVFVSDGRSWADFGTIATGQGKRLATMAEEWMIFRARNPRARLVLIDVRALGMTRVLGHPEVLQVGGFSDAMFRVISLFAEGKLDVEH